MRSIVLFAAAAALVCLTPPSSAKEITGHHHGSDRTHLHGMALFGKSVHYLAHIPLMSRPHNEQLIMRVTLKTADGAALAGDFSSKGHSIKPKSMLSLDDLAMGKTKTFTGDLYAGNFEHGVPTLHENVTVEVSAVLIARNLPGAPTGDEYYLIGQSETYLVDRISASNNRQRIRRVSLGSPIDGLSAQFAVKVSLAKQGPSQNVVVKKAGSPASSSHPVSIAAELWCLAGPDFFSPCP